MSKKIIVIIALYFATNSTAAQKVLNHKNHSLQIKSSTSKPLTLHDAAQIGDIKRIEAILPYYDNVDIRNNDGESPLFVAVKHNNKDAAALFLSNKANPNTLNASGETPFMHAVANKSPECAVLLLNNNAKPDIGNFRPKDYLVTIQAFSPTNTKITENFKFMTPVHAALLSKRLAPLYKQQQHKLYLLTKFICQTYLKDSYNDILMHITLPLINDWIETHDSSQFL
jgi:ankyrin repeat protein